MDTSPPICLQVTFGKSVNRVSSGFSTPALSESYVNKNGIYFEAFVPHFLQCSCSMKATT